MADYIAQPDTAVDPDAPVTSDLMYALRDNPIAIAEGAAGAPRIADAALSTTVTPTGYLWVGNRYAALPVRGVGSVVMAIVTRNGATAVVIPFGGSAAGSELSLSNANGENSGNSLTGSWICLGHISDARPSATGASRSTIWKRVS